LEFPLKAYRRIPNKKHAKNPKKHALDETNFLNQSKPNRYSEGTNLEGKNRNYVKKGHGRQYAAFHGPVSDARSF